MESPERLQAGQPYQDRARRGSEGRPILSWWECRYYRGNAAAGPIMDHLSDRPKAQALAARVVTFYGDCLLYRESPTLPSSFYEIGLHHDPIELKHARIELQLGTNRTAEALSHESASPASRDAGLSHGRRGVHTRRDGPPCGPSHGYAHNRCRQPLAARAYLRCVPGPGVREKRVRGAPGACPGLWGDSPGRVALPGLPRGALFFLVVSRIFQTLALCATRCRTTITGGRRQRIILGIEDSPTDDGSDCGHARNS